MNKQELLLNAMKIAHGTQLRKYTNEPYWYHLIEVAEIIRPHNIFLGVEIAYCHDVLEDTPTTYLQLIHIITNCGYELWEALYITSGVIQLTDVYTTESYPDMNRQQRKALEAIRLSNTTPVAQSVKYGDLISNTTSITQYDPTFAITYKQEKIAILDVCKLGEPTLYERALTLATT